MPDIKVKFVSPDNVRRPKRERLTPEQAGVQARLEHLYPVKALVEKLFGCAAFMRIKMGGSMSDWRGAGLKLLDAIDLSVKSTVEIADGDWFKEVAEAIAHGKEGVRDAETIDALQSRLVATLAQLVFIQLGNFPRHPLHKTTPLTAEWWTLKGYRTVQYVQSPHQKENQAQLNAKRAESARRAASDSARSEAKETGN
jgi:hypothetical protein